MKPSANVARTITISCTYTLTIVPAVLAAQVVVDAYVGPALEQPHHGPTLANVDADAPLAGLHPAAKACIDSSRANQSQQQYQL